MSGVKKVDFSLVLYGFSRSGGRLWEASGIKNIDFSLVLEAFWKSGKSVGEVSGVQNLSFPLVLEAFLKGVDAFFEKPKETLEGLWGKKPLFCLRF